jgi:hypothetical protein
MAIIVRDPSSGKVLNVSQDLPQGLKGKVLTKEQSQKISSGEYEKTRSGIKIKTDKGVTIIQGEDMQKTPSSKYEQEQRRISNVRAREQQVWSPRFVYDVTGQQSRELTPFEQTAYKQILNDSRRSFLPNQAKEEEQDYFKQRNELMNNPRTDQIFILQDPENNPFFVTTTKEESAIASSKKKDPDMFKGYSISAAKKPTIWQKVKGQGKEFMQGFNFQADPLGRDPRYSRGAAYNLGNVAGIVTSSVVFWEGVGSGAANIGYRYAPRATIKTTQVIGEYSKSPLGKKLLRAGYIAYGTDVATNLVKGYREDKEIGLAREGLKSTRLMTSMIGTTSGFQKQLVKNIGQNVHVVYGKSKALTTSNKRLFTTKIKTTGKVTTFTKYGKPIQTQQFRDITKISGKSENLFKIKGPSKTTETVDLIQGESKSFSEFTKGKGFSRTKPVSSIATETNIGVVSRTRTQELFKIITPETTISKGIGGSRFRFTSDVYKPFSNEYELIGGSGRVPRFEYTQTNDITQYIGRTKSLTPKVATDLKFKETVLNVGRSKTSTTSGGILKQQSKNIGANIGKLSQKTMTSNIQQSKILGGVVLRTKPVSERTSILPMVKAVNISESKIKPLTFTKQTSISKLESTNKLGTILGGITETNQKGRGKSKSEYRGELSLKTENFQETNIIGGLISKQVPKSIQQPISSQRSAQIQEYKIKKPSEILIGGGFRFSQTPPIITPDPFINLNIPKNKPRKQKRGLRKKKLGKKKKGYSSSIEANVLNIQSMTMPSKRSIESGLFTRPIITRRRRR